MIKVKNNYPLLLSSFSPFPLLLHLWQFLDLESDDSTCLSAVLSSSSPPFSSVPSQVPSSPLFPSVLASSVPSVFLLYSSSFASSRALTLTSFATFFSETPSLKPLATKHKSISWSIMFLANSQANSWNCIHQSSLKHSDLLQKLPRQSGKMTDSIVRQVAQTCEITSRRPPTSSSRSLFNCTIRSLSRRYSLLWLTHLYETEFTKMAM